MAALLWAAQTVRKLWHKAVLVSFAILLVWWAGLFATKSGIRSGPNGFVFDNVFATFLSSARVQESGGNLYDPKEVCATETAMLHAQHVPAGQPVWNCRVGNPPLFFWLLRPVLHVPFIPAGYAWLLLIELTSVVGLLGVLSAFGWRRWRFIGCVAFLLMPPTVYSTYYGEPDALVFAGIGLSLALLRRHPVLAGALLTIVWLKPTLGLPAALLIWLFQVSNKSRFASGFMVGTGLLFCLTLVTTGWRSVGAWGHSLVAFSGDTAVRVHQASLIGLYVRWAPTYLRASFEAVILLVAIAATWWHWRRRYTPDEPLIAAAWLWAVWFLAVPYGQYYDEMVLAVPVLALAGRNGQDAARPRTILVLYALFLGVALGFVSMGRVDPESLIVAVVALALWSAARRPDTCETGKRFPARSHADRALAMTRPGTGTANGE